MNLTKTPFASVSLHNTAAGLLQLLGGPGEVNFVSVYNGSASTVYLQFFDQTASPAAAEVPDRGCVPIPAGNYYESDSKRGVANGCWLGISSTAMTFTAAGATVYLDAGGCHA